MRRSRTSVPRWQYDATILLMLTGIFFFGMRVWVLQQEVNSQMISPLSPFQPPVIRTEVHAVEVYPETIDQMISDASQEFQIEKFRLHCILYHESRYNPEAIGDSGKAVGIAQFWSATWKGFRKLMNEEVGVRTDARESIRTLAWALADGRGGNWTPVLDGRCY